MKRAISLVLVLCLLFTLCACGGPKMKTVDHVKFDTTDMTDLQKALVITAESYYLRGKRSQYDQTSYGKGVSRSVSRRSTADRKPEDYTSQYFGYHDCSSFVFDVYYSALGFDFSESSSKRNTKWYMENQYVVLKETPELIDYTYEELEELKQEFLDALQPGDIINYRKRGNGAGHAMLYVGNDTLIHSQGSDYAGAFENYESNGTYSIDTVSELLLDITSTRYLFNKHSYAILRPLNGFTGEIPADTVARADAMRGIMAEKLSSHTLGQTVSVGGEVTFTFHMENRSSAEKVLTVTDTVPEGTTYVSGAEAVNGNTLTWNVTVPADGEADVSYTVKVNEGTKTVYSESNISGVTVNCPAITVANTLTADQQTAIVSAVESKKTTLKGLALADAAYREVLGYEKLGGMTAEQLLGSVYYAPNDTDVDLNAESALAGAVVPRLYGGMKVVEVTPNNYYRVRLLQEQHLIAGDLIVGDDETYFYTGDALLSLDSGEEVEMSTLEWFVGYFNFAVIRPSMDV